MISINLRQNKIARLAKPISGDVSARPLLIVREVIHGCFLGKTFVALLAIRFPNVNPYLK